mgnify:CR=1 FL=1
MQVRPLRQHRGRVIDQLRQLRLEVAQRVLQVVRDECEGGAAIHGSVLQAGGIQRAQCFPEVATHHHHPVLTRHQAFELSQVALDLFDPFGVGFLLQAQRHAVDLASLQQHPGVLGVFVRCRLDQSDRFVDAAALKRPRPSLTRLRSRRP